MIPWAPIFTFSMAWIPSSQNSPRVLMLLQVTYGVLEAQVDPCPPSSIASPL